MKNFTYHMKALICGYYTLWKKRALLLLKEGHAPENEPWTFSIKINLPLTTTEIV